MDPVSESSPNAVRLESEAPGLSLRPAASKNSVAMLPSLPEVYRSVPIAGGASFLRKMLAFAGPGYLVAVGYMDPGNWATDIGGGSQFGYALLSVVIISSLAEVLGSAVALKLLFGIPLLAGVLITGTDVLIVLALQGRGFRWIEALVITLIATIAACFAYELFFAEPLWREAATGLVPPLRLLHDRDMLYLAIGILGATVMPHNLYLHSSIVQTRAFGLSSPQKREAIRFATLDSTIALGFSLFVNAAILILGAAAFHHRGLTTVADISQAYKLLTPVLGAGLASTLFAAALLCSGQNSTLTGTLAGQVVMEGFLSLQIKPWLRRLITRSAAIIPAALVIGIAGETRAMGLLILSQVILSFQLPFALVPLVQFTGDKRRMGEFANSWWVAALAWFTAAVIIALNALLIFLIFRGNSQAA